MGKTLDGHFNLLSVIGIYIFVNQLLSYAIAKRTDSDESASPTYSHVLLFLCQYFGVLHQIGYYSINYQLLHLISTYGDYHG
jgi:hypothetical protein